MHCKGFWVLFLLQIIKGRKTGKVLLLLLSKADFMHFLANFITRFVINNRILWFLLPALSENGVK